MVLVRVGAYLTKRDRRELSGNSASKINVNGAMTHDSGSAGGTNEASGVSEAMRIKLKISNFSGDEFKPTTSLTFTLRPTWRRS